MSRPQTKCRPSDSSRRRFCRSSGQLEAVDQFPQPLLRVTDDRYAVTYKDCVEVEREQLLDAAPQARRVVHHALAEQAQMPGRIPYNRVAYDQGFSLGPKECHLARTLSADAYYLQRPNRFAVVKLTVEHGALPFRVGGVVRMKVGTSAGALANLVCGAHMIPVRDENSAHAHPDEFAHHVIVRLDRVDTDVSVRIANQQAV